MPTFQSDDGDIEIDKYENRGYPMLSGYRAKSLTLAWILVVLVATAGWLYFIARAGWFIANWFLR